MDEREIRTITGGESWDRDDRIGPYLLRQEIGRGGMGVVYLAEQEQPVKRLVALKLVKVGMDTEGVVARFEAERQALALMNHPGIAQVLDAGSTPEGRPYFVMEYVRGKPITDYCDGRKLGTADRLELFGQVCDAVHHAHQKGIIHRDLKPSNVLVAEPGDRAVVKIIDFGVSKAVNKPLVERQHYTDLGHIVGTPLYMSPEQAEGAGNDIDIRTDVYALGVLLYELLVGAPPFDQQELLASGYDAMRRKICEQEPPRPSTRLIKLGTASTEAAMRRKTDPGTLARQLRDDLDWIVMKALEKDRRRRYGSASDLGADIERHLRQEPVLAGPPSVTYKARKFVLRHRFGVAGAALLALSLIGGITGTSVGWLRARRAEAATRREAQTALAVSDFLVRLFEVSDPGAARGNSITAKEVLEHGVRQIRHELASEPAVRARLLETMGTVYRSLGLYTDARPLLESAHREYEAVAGISSPEAAASLNSLVGLLLLERAHAADLAGRALALNESVHGPDSIETARAANNLGQARMAAGDLDAAEPLFRRALAIRERVQGQDHPDVAKMLNNLGTLCLRRKDLAGARQLLERALSIREATLPPDHPDIAKVSNNLGRVLEAQGDAAGAILAYRRALSIHEKTLPPDHPDLIQTLAHVARLSLHQEEPAAARSALERLLALQEKRLGVDHADLAVTLDLYAELEKRVGRLGQAEALTRRSRAIRTSPAAVQPSS